MNKPFAPSCERNQSFIYERLAPLIEQHSIKAVLEIASGTGQHAVYFSRRLNQLLWQSSDLSENLPGITRWLDDAKLGNTPAPIALDTEGHWPVQIYDAVYTANSLHIMSEIAVQCFFENLADISAKGCLLMVYGPFNRCGHFTATSNREFDAWLKAQNPLSGIRDFEWVNQLAQEQGFILLQDHALPANNCFIVWQKT